MSRYYIGIDDHDSPERGCTTHFSFILIKKLEKLNVKLVGYPNLVRLNPNIPWKTRGNAAVSLTIETDRDQKELLDIIWNESLSYVHEISKGPLYKRSPGVAVVRGNRESLNSFYWKAVSDVVTPEYLKIVLNKFQISWIGGRGVIGSLAAIGFQGTEGTFELLTYRKETNWERRRDLDLNSLVEYDERFFPKVYANVDYVEKSPMILSHGKDPVFFGLRGTEPDILLKGVQMLRFNEEIEGYLIFRTNQGSDDHLKILGSHPYQSGGEELVVKSTRVLEGGDSEIITDKVPVIVYKETGELNAASRLLKTGDVIRVYGALKPSRKFGLILEAERMEVIDLKRDLVYLNPKCPTCNGSSESLGRGKGFRCRRCGFRFHGEKQVREVDRKLSLGLYQTRKYRHLTRPIFWIQ
ncbi:DUF1743 domain-containing protein [Metallosphaera tengchongensis]|uniref:tRNA(Ile2) 2-agmatinylcytidine synthetase TiaS n=1 Tax=Metallosphaera tengchongensis TaxID=1532350 RepID=A0A6N0NT28_9CREN|nr:tRNA(Ile)(2)-agmatinylcytidine synthase [Metallosphaera tengchongensis]QKQ99861.1 DUF1743 domain-containing protein [Metallosphaera tengchongensis]